MLLKPALKKTMQRKANMSIADDVQKQLMQVRREAIELHSSDQVQEAIAKLAFEVTEAYSGKVPVFVTIMNGGMIFASCLSLQLNLDMEMDYLQLSRYGKSQEGGQLVWKYQPEVNLSNKHVILCDDIYDEGHTLAAAHAWCLKKGALSAHSAVLIHKNHDRDYADYKADYVAMEVEDHFIFGFGMDLGEKLRQLPEIYYLPDGLS